MLPIRINEKFTFQFFFSSCSIISFRLDSVCCYWFFSLHFTFHLSHQKKTLFLHRKNAQFFFVSTRTFFFTNTMNFLERQLHSGCMWEVKNHQSTKREWKRKFFFCWQSVCAKKWYSRETMTCLQKGQLWILLNIFWIPSSDKKSILHLNVIKHPTNNFSNIQLSNIF